VREVAGLCARLDEDGRVEGLTDVNVTSSGSGLEVELRFRAPPQATIDAAQWAMVNKIPFYFTGPTTGSMLITDVEIEQELIDASTFGSTATTYFVGIKGLVVRGYLRP
jgi:hypothetical protein